MSAVPRSLLNSSVLRTIQGALFILFFFFSIVFAPFLSAQNDQALETIPTESTIPTPANRDGQSWYDNLVLTGRLLQTPEVMIDGSGRQLLLLLTEDRRILLQDFERGALWEYRLPRLAAERWYASPGGMLHVPMRSGDVQVVSIRDGEPRYRYEELPLGEGGSPELFRSLADGRLLRILQNGQLHLSFDAGGRRGGDLVFALQISGDSHIIAGEVNDVYAISAEKISRFSADGALLGEVALPFTPDRSFVSSNRLFLHDDESRLWSGYSPDLSEVDSGIFTGSGLLFQPLLTGRDRYGLYISYDANSVWLSDGLGNEVELLRLEEQWTLTHVVIKGSWLYLADSAWRVHRIDLEQTALDFFDARLVIGERNIPEAQHWRFLYNLLISSSADGTELERQLDSIILSARRGALRGRLFSYQKALENFLTWSYRPAEGGAYQLSDPALRLKVINASLSLGGDGLAAAVVEGIRREVSPEVISAVLDGLTGRTHPAELRLVEFVEGFLLSSQEWQRPGYLLESYYRYLMDLADGESGVVRSAEYRRQVVDALELLFTFLDDPQARRRILRMNSSRNVRDDTLLSIVKG